jgi:indole-3-glycerol phosphate synthase
MDILNTIATRKRLEVAERKELYPAALLERSPYFGTTPVSLTKYLLRPSSHGLIAEFKRQSPSKGVINAYAKVEEVSIGYMQSGASALSVLTDTEFFGGKSSDLTTARDLNYCPILRKDFILDPYQVIEAKSIGADAVLLIAAILTPEETLSLATLARSLGMETLLEVHGREELGHLNDRISIVGVNNRNLKDFRVSIDNSLKMAEFLPDDIPAISESGIHSATDALQLREAGYKGFLVGELFMATADPALACREFVNRLKQLGI